MPGAVCAPGPASPGRPAARTPPAYVRPHRTRLRRLLNNPGAASCMPSTGHLHRIAQVSKLERNTHLAQHRHKVLQRLHLLRRFGVLDLPGNHGPCQHLPAEKGVGIQLEGGGKPAWRPGRTDGCCLRPTHHPAACRTLLRLLPCAAMPHPAATHHTLPQPTTPCCSRPLSHPAAACHSHSVPCCSRPLT